MFLQQTAAASLVALFLLVLQRIFLDKLSPRWQYGVWLVLLLRLLFPVGAFGRQTVLDISFWLELLRTHVELDLHSVYSSPFVNALPVAPIPMPAGEAPVSWTDWLFVLYCAGVILCLGWFLLCALRLSRRVGQGVPVEGTRRAAIQALAEQYKLPAPRRVVECRWEHSPFLLGGLRPTLVLPMGWEVDEKVVLHELLHLKHRDVWAGWLTTIFRCLHWCNPILWHVFDKIGNDRESLCDQRVLERLAGEERRDYGRVLLSMADDRQVRTPGATTMANGARAVKARIQAIARFKRFPQGMGLVSGCIVAALSLSLVAGVPAAAAGAAAPVETPDGTGVAGVLATAAQNRATTVSGALDAYGKAHSYRYWEPANALLCAAIAAPEEEMPDVLAWYETSLAERGTDRDFLHRWWRTGPVFRGLVSDGADGYLCQVFWFRDVELESETDPLWPEEGEPWPVEYLCHTVRIRPDGRYWTVEKLAETTGVLENGLEEYLTSWRKGGALYGPVTWSGEANGVSVELSHTAQLQNNGDIPGLKELREFQGDGEGAEALLTAPVPDEGFYFFMRTMQVQVSNWNDTACPVRVEAVPGWKDPEILPSGSRDPNSLQDTKEYRQSSVGFCYESTLSLAPGETFFEIVYNGGGGGGSERDLWRYVGPDFYTVTVQAGPGEPFQIPLTPRYATPDGGSYTLEGGEAP